MTKKLLTILSILLLIFTVSACKKQEQVFDGEERESINGEEKVKIIEEDLNKDRTFKSELIDFSFTCPAGSECREITFSDNKGKYEGESVVFRDKKNKRFSFRITIKDFEPLEGAIFGEIFQIDTNNTKKPIHVSYNSNFEENIKIKDNVYQVIGFNNYECSSFVESYLVYLFPKESKFEYAAFNLGVAEGFSDSEFEGTCNPKKEAIYKRIERIKEGEIDTISNKLDLALGIIDSFTK